MEKQYLYKRLALLPIVWAAITCLHVFGLFLLPDTPMMWFKLSYADYADGLTQGISSTLDQETSLILPLSLYLKKALLWDFGQSVFLKKPVLTVITQHFPITFYLTLSTFVPLYTLSIIIAWGRLKQYALARYTHYCFLQISAVPSCLLYTLSFCISYQIAFDFGSYGYVFAVVFLIARRMAPLTSFILKCLHRESEKPYLLYARRRGVNRTRLMFSYLLKNALIPVWIRTPKHFTQILFSGTLTTEVLFSIDGLGRASFFAMKHIDYPLILGCLICSSSAISIAYLLGDILHQYLSPNIHIGVKR